MGTYFFRKKPWKFFFYPWKFQTEQSFPQEIPQNCVAPLSEIPCHGQKPTPMGVQHNFFLITPANFFFFVIKPQNFHMLFPQYPWKSHVLNPPCLVFLEQPNQTHEGNSMSDHPGNDTLTSEILFIFSLFVDSVEMINPCKFQYSTPLGFGSY